MFFLLLKRVLLQDRVRTGRVVFAIALGAAVTTSVLGVSVGIGDQVQRELTSYGANIEVVSTGRGAGSAVDLGGIQYAASDEAATIPVADLVHFKDVFWRNNIVAFAPFLSSTFDLNGRPVTVVGAWFHEPLKLQSGERFVTGAPRVQPWWHITGSWPQDSASGGCLVGAGLAQSLKVRPGDHLPFLVNGQSRPLTVTGILRSGGPEDQEVIAPLTVVQEWTGHPGKAARVEVSALVKPDDALSRKNPKTLTPDEQERKICSPYMSEITSELTSAVPGTRARPVYRVADSAGKLLDRIELLMAFVLGAALLASLMGAGSATAAAALQRRHEVALSKALGATVPVLVSQLTVEALVLGAVGGLIGAPVGLLVGLWIGKVVFGVAATTPWIVLPLGLALAFLISVASGVLPLWTTLQVDPVRALSDE